MVNDGLNQIGKYVKRTRDKTNRAVDRFYPNLPLVDIIRDVVDPTVPIIFWFETKARNSTVALTLTFLPPPPRLSCADCYCNVCEYFRGESTPVMTYAYIPGSVTVFKNNKIQANSAFDETDPVSGLVTITVSVAATDVIKVCYVYSTC